MNRTNATILLGIGLSLLTLSLCSCYAVHLSQPDKTRQSGFMAGPTGSFPVGTGSVTVDVHDMNGNSFAFVRAYAMVRSKPMYAIFSGPYHGVIEQLPDGEWPLVIEVRCIKPNSRDRFFIKTVKSKVNISSKRTICLFFNIDCVPCMTVKGNT